MALDLQSIQTCGAIAVDRFIFLIFSNVFLKLNLHVELRHTNTNIEHHKGRGKLCTIWPLKGDHRLIERTFKVLLWVRRKMLRYHSLRRHTPIYSRIVSLWFTYRFSRDQWQDEIKRKPQAIYIYQKDIVILIQKYYQFILVLPQS